MCNATVAESRGAPGVPRAETGFIFIGNIESVTQTGAECPTVPPQLPDCVKLQDPQASVCDCEIFANIRLQL